MREHEEEQQPKRETKSNIVSFSKKKIEAAKRKSDSESISRNKWEGLRAAMKAKATGGTNWRG